MSTTWDNQEKSGIGWAYNEISLSYNSDTDPLSGDQVYYNGVGNLTTYTNQSKS